MQTEKHQKRPYTNMSDNIEGTPKGSYKRTISAKKQTIVINSSLAMT